MEDHMPINDVPITGSEEWTFIQTFTSDEENKLVELDEFMAYPAHRDETQGFWFPPPTGKEVKVYCKSYEKDDSDPAVRKRHITVVKIPAVN